MNRNGLIEHIKLHAAKEGSLNALAKKIGINPGALSVILRGKYGANENAMLARIAARLDYRERNWKTVRTLGNYRTIEQVFDDARRERLWFALANMAGSGKTETLEDLCARDVTGAVVLVQAGEWGARRFLSELIAKTLGTHRRTRYPTVDRMIADLVGWCLDNAAERPLLIIDEADKLRPAALRTLVPIYNGTRDAVGAIVAGTENLKKELGEGVRRCKKGYDEIRSRLGISRSNEGYISLKGATRDEVFEICKANGIESDDLCEAIWNEPEKTYKPALVKTNKGLKNTTIEYCEDFRRLSRIIKREQIKLKNESADD